MPATVNISETNGTIAGAVTTDGITNLNFGSFDGPNLVTADHKIIRGANSVAKWLRLHVAALGDSSYVTDIRIWKDSGAFVAGEGIGCNLAIGIFQPGYTINNASGYGHATSDHGSGVVTPMPYLGNQNGVAILGTSWNNGPVQIPTSDPGSSNLAIADSANGTLAGAGYSNYLAMATTSTTSTPGGLANPKVIKFQWDEF